MNGDAITTLRALLKRPVAYHRVFAEIGGGACAGLMLSQAWYWTPRGEDGWFYKSMQEWEEETGLTRTEQETARERLTKRGLMEIKRAGMPARLYFKVDAEKLLSLIAEKPQSSLQKTYKQEAPQAADMIAENPQTTIKDTETTAETTTETTSDEMRAEGDPPSWLDHKAWSRWLNFRREIRHPVKPTQAEAQFKHLENLKARGHPPSEVIEQSIRNGWQGLFELKVERSSNGKHQQDHKSSNVDRIKRNLSRFGVDTASRHSGSDSSGLP